MEWGALQMLSDLGLGFRPRSFASCALLMQEISLK
jgi:hypothetical protein